MQLEISSGILCYPATQKLNNQWQKEISNNKANARALENKKTLDAYKMCICLIFLRRQHHCISDCLIHFILHDSQPQTEKKKPPPPQQKKRELQ